MMLEKDAPTRQIEGEFDLRLCNTCGCVHTHSAWYWDPIAGASVPVTKCPLGHETVPFRGSRP
jgi:hypothetical protein